MTYKVLVADDSQTIQKVISITLSSSSYEIVEVLNYEDLKEKLDDEYNLIIFDFNLAEEKNGYELAQEIKSKNNAPVMAMLGTFDSVDEQKLNESGVSSSIVKPFESSEFVLKCDNLLDSNNDNVEESPAIDKSNIEEDPKASNEDESDWSISSPSDGSPEIPSEVNEVSEAKVEISDWIAPIPQVIGQSSDLDTLPPAIDSNLPKEDETGSFELPDEIKKASDVKTPEVNDLEYPDVGKTPKFDTLDDFPDDDFEEETLSQIPIPVEEGIEEIEIDKSAEEFWAVDEDLPTAEEADISFEEPSDELPAAISSFNEDQLVAKILEKLRPLIKEEVENFCKENVDKVAWEVIPDLAENLIKKEISQISESIE